jgi:cytochrome c oxidase subunit 4
MEQAPINNTLDPPAGSERAASGSHTRTYLVVFGVLLALLVATVGVNELHLGRLAFFAAAFIATTKAVLIMLFFMHVWQARPLTRLAAAAGFAWLTILFGLAFTDYALRPPGGG